MDRTVTTRKDALNEIRRKERGVGFLSPEQMLEAGVEIEKPPDEYLPRLLKYIPSEIVGGYLALDGIARGSEEVLPWLPLHYWLWGFFVLCLLLTPVYLNKFWNVTKRVQFVILARLFLYGYWRSVGLFLFTPGTRQLELSFLLFFL